MKKIFLASLGALALITSSACDNSGSGVPAEWYDASGQLCGNSPYPGCNYFSNGAKITVYYDPYYGMNDYQPGWGYCDWSGEYCDMYWYSPSGIWYDSYGYALNSRRTAGGGRDVIGDVAAEEQAADAATAKRFAEKFALTDDRARTIVKGLREWELLTRSRARTAADYAALASRVAGIPTTDALAAIVAARRGDVGAVDSFNDELARFWGTDAETTRDLVRSWLGAQGLSN